MQKIKIPKKVYVAKYTGNHWNTREEAIRDNAKWLRDPLNRFTAKSKAYPTYKDFTIPFIKEISLSISIS